MLFVYARLEDFLNPVKFNSHKNFEWVFIVTHNL